MRRVDPFEFVVTFMLVAGIGLIGLISIRALVFLVTAAVVAYLLLVFVGPILPRLFKWSFMED